MMKRTFPFLAIALFVLSCSPRFEPVSGTLIPLYESEADALEEGCLQMGGGQRTLYNVSAATLEYFAPAEQTGTAMLVVPGGGFQILSYDGEGTMVAQELNRRGIAAFVLKYRTQPLLDEDGRGAEGFNGVMKAFATEVEKARSKFDLEQPGETAGTFDLAIRIDASEEAFSDADAAVRWIRNHAKEYGIKRLGMVGFSAGAIMTLHQAQVHSVDSRPDFIGVIYGGWDTSLTVPEDGMPLFLCSPVNDVFTPEESLRVYQKWHEAGLPVEYHLYYDCSHGFGANSTEKNVDGWLDLFCGFMKDVIKQ